MYAKSALLPTEDPEAYRKHQEALDTDLKPEGPLQLALAHMISDNIWRAKRLQLLEDRQADIYFAELAKRNALQSPQPGPNDVVPNPDGVVPDQAGFVPKAAVGKDDPNYRNLDALGRHHQRMQNGAVKILKTLRDLQKEIRIANHQAEEESGELEQKVLAKLRAEYNSRRYNSKNPFSPYWNGDVFLPTPPDEVLERKNPVE